MDVYPILYDEIIEMLKWDFIGDISPTIYVYIDDYRCTYMMNNQ